MCNTGEGEPSRIVVAESAIDAMSYAQLSKKPGLYVSFAGGLSGAQFQQLKDLLARYPSAKVIAATDNDKQGDKYAGIIAAIRPDAERARPTIGNDWNETLDKRSAIAR
jgi:hypothetical protein